MGPEKDLRACNNTVHFERIGQKGRKVLKKFCNTSVLANEKNEQQTVPLHQHITLQTISHVSN